MERQDIIRFWGQENLRRWSEEDLRDVAIPRSSKSFLVEVGLPFREDWTLRFDRDSGPLPRLPNKSYYRRIGFDGPVPICLDEHGGGRVVAAEHDGTARYINSSIEVFGESLVFYQQYRKEARTASDDEVQDIIAETEEHLRDADPTAFGDANNWWPVIVEQMKQGLL